MSAARGISMLTNIHDLPTFQSWHRIVNAVLLLLMLGTWTHSAVAQAPKHNPTWLPDPPRYKYGEKKNIAVRMDDGIVLRADEYYPTDAITSARARGRFPVLLVQTPYGKDRALQNLADYFVRRGYVLVIADMRGFGESQGQAAWFDARTGRDGAELADWAAKLDEADGKVGLMGCSYLGVAQFFTASHLRRESPVKAMAPFCVDSNFYRDLTAFGGIPTQFVTAVRAVTTSGAEDDPARDPFMHTIISLATQDNAYYSDYWESLNVTTLMPKIVSLGVPVLTESGWHDIFPGGNIDAEVAAENALQHRPVDQVLKSGTVVSGRYQAIVGNWTHAEHTGDSLLPIMLSWFDTWLKGKSTGIADTDKPLHLYQLGANRWIDSATYPITDQATTFYLSPGSLSDKGSPGVGSADQLCAAIRQGLADCSQRLLWAPEGPGATLTFDSGKLNAPMNITGPGDVTLYVRSSRPDVELSATLFDVDPAGHASKVTNGAQLGSQRTLNQAASWYSKDGRLIRPSHFFTKEKSSPVPLGETVRIDIELLSSLIRIPAGHQLRLVVASQPSDDFRQYGATVQLPNPLTPTPEQFSNLVGGVYTILFGSEGPSAVNLSTANEADLVSSTVDWGPGN
jgi:hypothetical protein